VQAQQFREKMILRLKSLPESRTKQGSEEAWSRARKRKSVFRDTNDKEFRMLVAASDHIYKPVKLKYDAYIDAGEDLEHGSSKVMKMSSDYS